MYYLPFSDGQGDAGVRHLPNKKHGGMGGGGEGAA